MNRGLTEPTRDGHAALPACGAHLTPQGGCRWRVWAPLVREVQLVMFDDLGRRTVHLMKPVDQGYFEFEAVAIPEGLRYAYQLNWQATRPDPASRWQPEGVHQPSAVWNPRFEWSDRNWQGISREDLVLYELHVGTFTPAGTFAAVIERLPQLRDLGITAIELMPVAQFPGRRNWGYDGTYWNAVQNSYGGPRELQRLVDACHQIGLGVFLDVVYNHVGPEGNYLGDFGPYFTRRVHTPWGRAINYDEAQSDEVRAFVLHNVRQWIRDFHIDGLRLDAVHELHDRRDAHISAEMKAAADEEAARLHKQVQVIAESNRNDVRYLWDSDDTGYGLDALWNDDFHHSVHALVTEERDGYYSDFNDPPAQLEKVFNRAFAYDGNYSRFHGCRHGLPVGNLTGDRFVVSIQNHDQIGNRARGERLGQLVPFNRLRLCAALMLLSPYIPQLFMGEEHGAQNPFPYFCDFSDPELCMAVQSGRRREFASFDWADEIPNPCDESTFIAAQLKWEGAPDDLADPQQLGLRDLYRDLLSARRTWPALRDMVYRQAHRIQVGEGQTILAVVRGDPTFPDQQIEAFFNLADAHVALPKPPPTQNEILLRTEERRYGGDRISNDKCWLLAPYECLVVGRRPAFRA